MVSLLFQVGSLLPSLGGSIASEVLLVIGILAVLFLIFRMGKLVLGLVINSILGIIAMFVLDAIFQIGIPINLVTVIATALFGLPAVAIMVLFRLSGIAL